jgi:fructokinase
MRVIVAGEALVDLVGDADGRLLPLPGGSPFNVAVGLGRLDVPTGFLGAIADDGFGTLLAARLDDAGVTILPATRTPRPTTLAMVHLDTDGHASYGFYLAGTSATGMTDGDVAAAAADAPSSAGAALHVSLGAVTLAAPGTGALLGRLLADARSRPLVSLDPNVRPAVMGDLAAERAAIAAAVAVVDLVKVSDADLEALHPDRDPLAVAGEWARSGPALVVVTRGAQGATALRSDGGRLTVASLPVHVVDTVGAGDAFTAGLLAALDERSLLERSALGRTDVDTLREVLTFAARVAALTCMRHGADPPRRSELDAPDAPC